MRIKKSIYNMLFGILNQIVAITIGLVVPRMFILTYGSEVNGLLSSISQVFVYVALLEAGIGTTTVQALYAPLSKNDRLDVNSILSATNIYYKKVGKIYLLAVIALAFIYPLVIKSSIDFFTVVAVILLIGLSGVLTFFFQGKIRLLLQAEGKGYVTTNITMLCNILTTVTKIVLILKGYNIIYIHIVYFLINIIQIFLLFIYLKKDYKWINFKETPNFKALSQKNSVFIHQISSLIFYNTDIILITIFCGLKTVSVYAMYNTLFNLIYSLLSSFDGSMVFALGQKYNEDRTEFLKMNSAYELLNITLVFSLYCITFIFVLPFIKLYTTGIVDINYVDIYLPILFVSSKLLASGRNASGNIINLAGHFKKTQYRSIIESTINIILSLICVNIFGVYGVLIGTITALLYRANDMILYANITILKRSPFNTYLCWIVNLVLFLIVIFVSKLIQFDNTSYIKIILNAGISAIIVVPIFFIVNFVVRKKDFDYVKIIFSRYFLRS